MKAFIDEHRDVHGVEPICRVMQVAPSTYWLHAARRAQPALRPARAQRDDVLVEHIERVWRDNMQVYGARKVWRQLQREGITVARCTVERLMRRQGLRGVVRGKVVRTTVADTAVSLPSDKGVAAVPRRPSQYVSIRYTERLAEAGIEPSVGSVGDSYDNALAETINGLYKAEVIHRRSSWKSKEAVELATLTWVAWFNHHRLLEPIGNIPPAEAEANYHRQLAESAVPA